MQPDPMDRKVSGGACLTCHSGLAEARALFRNSGQEAAVVMRSGRPIGIVTAESLIGLSRRCLDENLSLSAVLDYVAVPVRADASAKDTVEAFTAAASDWLKQRPISEAGRAPGVRRAPRPG